MINDFINNRVKEHYNYLKSLGYDVVAIFAQGSMNYGLYIQDIDYKSDVDTKAIVLPSLKDLIRGGLRWFLLNMITKENKLMSKI